MHTPKTTLTKAQLVVINDKLVNTNAKLLEALEDIFTNHIGSIVGPICGWCGRDNSYAGNRCTSDDCMGVNAHDAIAEAKGG